MVMISGLIFSNPWGFWGLLGIPAIILIHIFQQPSRPVTINTLFLIDKLAPESVRGASWDRFKYSLPFFLQLLLVLLVTWLLVQPRWIQEWSRLDVVMVLDSSASMEAYRDRAVKAAEDLVEEFTQSAQTVDWTLLESHAPGQVHYRGRDTAALLSAIRGWRPMSGHHDPLPVLEEGSALQGAEGILVYLTDHTRELPAGASLLSVGSPQDNVGFTGLSCSREGDEWIWKVLIRNYGSRAVERQVKISMGSKIIEADAVSLKPGGGKLIKGPFPPGVNKFTLMIEEDSLPLDDRLPVIRPAQEALTYRSAVRGKAGSLLQKILQGREARPDETNPMLEIQATVSDLDKGVAGLVLRSPAEAEGNWSRKPVTVENHPLVQGLNFDGLLSSGPLDYLLCPEDEVLVWQKGQPLIFLHTGEGEPKLVFTFDVGRSNADRLPAVILLINRYLDQVSRRLPLYRSENVITHQVVELPRFEGEEVRQIRSEISLGGFPQTVDNRQAQLRMPGNPGHFSLVQGNRILREYAVGFGDPHEGNLSRADARSTVQDRMETVQRKHSREDPLISLWIALIALILVCSWKIQPFSFS